MREKVWIYHLEEDGTITEYEAFAEPIVNRIEPIVYAKDERELPYAISTKEGVIDKAVKALWLKERDISRAAEYFIEYLHEERTRLKGELTDNYYARCLLATKYLREEQ